MEQKYTGLTEKQVTENRKKYGSNEILTNKKEKLLKLFIESFSDPMIKILLIALAIKTILLFQDFDWYETIGIVAAILIASIISSLSEYGSSKAFEKLQEESLKLNCKVIRNNKLLELNQNEIVVEDIIKLETGDKIPADGIIIKGNISVDESTIDGETQEKYKETNSKVLKGTVVYNGNAIMKVTKVGINTFYGKIAQELQEKQPESPIKKRLKKLAETISKIGYICAFLVAFSYLFYTIIIINKFNPTLIKNTITNFPILISHILYSLTLMVTVIVVSVPEGLPMMITLVLSSNMKRMLKDNVLVRKLVGIETAGNINILFTDKTGTITKGKLEVIKIINGEGKEYQNKKELTQKYLNQIETSIIYNTECEYTKEAFIGGNITDQALCKYIKKRKENNKIIKKIPFNSNNKYSISKIEINNQEINLIKGAFEKILPNCNYYYNDMGNRKYLLNKQKLINKIEQQEDKGIRIIALATSTNKKIDDLNNLTLVGIICIKDEIRKEAKEGISIAQEANIQVVMITGDNQKTAEAIAKESGILKEKSISITSTELQKMTDEEVKKILPNLSVVSRSLPSDKSRLVRISQEKDLIIGMTGDGVNDAPALKKADVGFSMGSGTEVAKEASDIILLDDNFYSITKAILYGRTIFKSIRKFIIFQLTVNFCAVFLSIIGPFIGVPNPITVIQMLWINMVMDTLAGLAFSYEPPLKEYMKEKPKNKNEQIINKYMIQETLIIGIYSSIIYIIFLKANFIKEIFTQDIRLMTGFFTLFIFTTIINSFNVRTERMNIFANIIKNKVFVFIITLIIVIQLIIIYYGGEIFRTISLNKKELLFVIITSLTILPVDILRKKYLKNKKIKSIV